MGLFFFLCVFIYLNWRIITLQYHCGFCHPVTWISHGYTCVPHPEHPLLCPQPIPLGCPRALALSTLLHALNLYWSSTLHMAMYMLQCYSLKSFHPCLLPLSSKVYSLHLFLLCCPECRTIITVFLNSIYIYALMYSICLSLWLTSLCIIGFGYFSSDFCRQRAMYRGPTLVCQVKMER